MNSSNQLLSGQILLASTSIFPGESIGGFVTRASSYFASKDLAMRTLGKTTFRTDSLLPSDLEKLRSVFGNRIPEASELLHRHTIFPLLAPFLPSEVVGTLRSHLTGKAIAGIAAQCGFHYGLGTRWRHAMCKQCMADDRAQGTPYWRAIHMVPGISVCPTHLTSLYTYCGECVVGHRNSAATWLPSTECACGSALIQIWNAETTVEREVESAIALMVNVILSCEDLASYSYEAILENFHRRSCDLGHFDPGGRKKLCAFIARRIGPRLASSSHFSLGRSLLNALGGKALLRNPIHNLMLIYALFGTLENFISFERGEAFEDLVKAEHFSATARKHLRGKRRKKYKHWYTMTDEELDCMRRSCRESLLLMKEENPDKFTRKSLRNNRNLQFLWKFDVQWLDEVMPCRPKRSPNEDRYAVTDKSLDAHLWARCDILLAQVPPVRITHRQLVCGHTMQSAPKSYFANLPQSRRTLELLTETVDAWRGRQTRYLLSLANEIPDAPEFPGSADLESLSEQQIKKLKCKVRKWLRANT